MLPISLQAKRGNWSRFKARRANENYRKLENKIIARDNNTCQFCGFQINKFLVCVNKDNDYGPGKSVPDNLVTACSLCAQCLFLDGIGQGQGWGGTLIYLPEISQSDLNHFCRALFTSMLKDAPYKGKLQTTYLSLKDRENIINETFGPQSSTPSIFGETLIDCNLKGDELKHPMLSHMRLLPDKKFFSKEISYWKSTVYAQVPL